MERGGDERSGEAAKNICGLSIPDTILFPEVEGVGKDPSVVKMCAAFGVDLDPVLGEKVMVDGADESRISRWSSFSMISPLRVEGARSSFTTFTISAGVIDTSEKCTMLILRFQFPLT